MADNSPSVELAPLKGSIILDLDQFDVDTDHVEDRIVSLAELFHIALNPHLNIDLNNFDESLSAAQEKIKNFKSEIDSINKEIDIKINTDFNESDLATLNKIRGLADDSSDISSNEDENNDNIDPAIFNNSGFDDVIPQGQDNTSHGEQEHRDIGELGDHLFDRGMMLQWTIAPMIDDADKSLIKLGFSTEAAFNLANKEFGKNSNIVQQWSKTTAENLGLSSSDALNLADRFGLSARSMGANKAQAADLAEHMTSLADQLSLATGGQISLSDAGQVLTGVMGGQMYGLKQLGVQFSTNQQNTEAAALGYGKVYSKLTPLQQAYVNTALLQSSLNGSLGSLSDNLGSNYGQWEKTKAQLQENAETMAMDLLPSLIELMHGVTHLVDWFSHLGKAGHLAAGGILLIATVVTPVLLAVGALIKIVTVTHKIFSKLFGLFKKGAKDTEKLGKAGEDAAKHSRGLFDIFKSIGRVVLDVSKSFIDWAGEALEAIGEIIVGLDPITLVIAAIVGAVIAAGVEIYKHWSAIKKFFISGIKDLEKHFVDFQHSAKKVIQEIGRAVTVGVKNVIKKIKHFVDSVKNSMDHLVTKIKQSIMELFHSIEHIGKSIVKETEKIIKNIYDKIVNNPIIHAILELDKAVLNLIATTVKAIIDIVGSMLHFLLSWVVHYADVIGAAISSFVGNAFNKIKHLFNIVISALSAFGDYVGNKISSVFGFIIHKISNLSDWVGTKVSSIFEFVMNKFRNFATWLGHEIMIPIHAIEKMATSIKNYMINGMIESLQGFKKLWDDLTSWFSNEVLKPVKSILMAMGKFQLAMYQGIGNGVKSFVRGWDNFISWFYGVVMNPIHALENTASDWLHAGESLIGSFFHGIVSGFTHIATWIGNEIGHLTSDIAHFGNSATNTLNRDSYHGSHATGLYNVPWDGYRAELHSGEMVLTKDQADEYRNGTGGANGGVNVTINSPRPLDPFEVKRQMEQYSRNLANGIY